MASVSNEELKTALLEFRDKIVKLLPLETPCDVDPRYAMATGLILGVITESLAAVRDNRPMKLKFLADPGLPKDEDPR